MEYSEEIKWVILSLARWNCPNKIKASFSLASLTKPSDAQHNWPFQLITLLSLLMKSLEQRWVDCTLGIWTIFSSACQKRIPMLHSPKKLFPARVIGCHQVLRRQDYSLLMGSCSPAAETDAAGFAGVAIFLMNVFFIYSYINVATSDEDPS